MHELSIAMSIIDLVEEEAERRGAASVSAIYVRVGPLSGVVRQALVHAYEIAIEGTSLAATHLVIEKVPVVVYCPSCNDRFELGSVQDFSCPKCRTPTPEIVQGRELEIRAMEVQ